MPKSIASPPSAAQQLRHFTDREKERDILNRLLAKREAPLPVVMFYGVGGVGKSWLLRKLREKLMAEYPTLPTALLDLELRAGGEKYHADWAQALAAIRQQFGEVSCPRFDLAYAWLRYRQGAADEPLLKGSGPAAAALEVVKGVATSVIGLPGVGYAVERLAEYVARHHFKNGRLEEWLLRKTGQEDFLKLRAMQWQEIYPELCERLIQDLVANVPSRGGGGLPGGDLPGHVRGAGRRIAGGGAAARARGVGAKSAPD